MDFFRNENRAEEMNEEVAPVQQVTQINKKKIPWATWTVKGRAYKLKLTTSKVIELEQKYKTNLMNVLGSGEGGMPALSVMLDVAHAALTTYEHGIKKQEVIDLFDEYEAEGGSQFEFYTQVYMQIFAASGFFSQSMAEKMMQTVTDLND